MAAAPTFFLSIPKGFQAGYINVELTDVTTIEEAREAATEAGMENFYAAGLEDSETVYATLYALTARGGLAHSECFPISGPEAY